MKLIGQAETESLQNGFREGVILLRRFAAVPFGIHGNEYVPFAGSTALAVELGHVVRPRGFDPLTC